MRICIYGASSNAIDNKYIEAVERLGERLAQRGHTLVFGGGAGGLMGAAARGFKRGGCKEIISVAPRFFDVDGKLFEGATEEYFPETMRERKMMLQEMADVIIAVPGGIGTFDEFFEFVTLKSLGRTATPVVLYNLFGFYSPMMKMLCQYQKKGFLNLNGDRLFSCIENEDDLIYYIENTEPEYLESKFFKTV